MRVRYVCLCMRACALGCTTRKQTTERAGVLTVLTSASYAQEAVVNEEEGVEEEACLCAYSSRSDVMLVLHNGLGRIGKTNRYHHHRDYRHQP